MKLSRYSLISLFAMLALAGCGGSSSTTPPPSIGKLYVAVLNANTILRFPAGANGDARPDVHLRFEPDGPAFISLDVPHNRMAVLGNVGGTPAVTLLDNASEGGPAPRVINGPFTAMGAHIGRCALDGTNDLVYVAPFLGAGIGSVLVFGPASTIVGNIAPLRTFTTGFNPSGFFIDSSNNRLFMANPGNDSIAIFDNASTLTGTVAPTRTIIGPATQINGPSEIVLDSSGRLIVSNDLGVPPGTANLLVFANAGAVNGNIVPVASSQINQDPIEMAISPAGELYVVDGKPLVTVYGNVASANGPISPIRVIQGPDTGLNFVMPNVPGFPEGVAIDTTR